MDVEESWTAFALMRATEQGHSQADAVVPRLWMNPNVTSHEWVI